MFTIHAVEFGVCMSEEMCTHLLCTGCLHGHIVKAFLLYTVLLQVMRTLKMSTWSRRNDTCRLSS